MQPHRLFGAIAESIGKPAVDPIPASGFSTGPDYTVNWEGLTTAASSITQQTGNVVRLSAGATLANGDSQHCQIVSKVAHPAGFKLTVNITVRDASAGSSNDEAGLLYWAMWGDTADGYDTDISTWTTMDGAAVDGSTRFEKHAFGYRMSYAMTDDSNINQNQIRLRESGADGSTNLVQIIGTGLPNTQPGSFPFVKDKTYRCVITKQGQSFDFNYQNITDAAQPILSFPNTSVAALGDYKVGRFIFRAMAGRIFDIEVVSVEDIGDTPDNGGGDGSNGELPPEIAAKTIRVTNEDDFQAVLTDNTKLDGWTIYVDPPTTANRVWNKPVKFAKVVDKTKQACVIRCATPGQVTLTDALWFETQNANGQVTGVCKNVILWGFNRRGANARTILAGEQNGIRRMDISGYQGSPGLSLNGPGSNLHAWYCSFHDPVDWTQAEKDKWNNNKDDALRMAIRSGSVSPTTMVDGAHIYACNVYNYPPKLDPNVYGSAQDDAFEAAQDVDQCAGQNPVMQMNWLIEKFLVEATHLEGSDGAGNTGKPIAGCATIDCKGGGMTFKKITLLAPGRMDNRGNGGNVYEDIYTERSMSFNGGGPVPATTEGGGHPAQPNAPGNRVTRLNCVTGAWGKPKIGVMIGNAPPNAVQKELNLDKMFQQCKNMIIEDIWGSAGITVGDDGNIAGPFFPDGTIVRRWEDTINVTVVAGKQTNTTTTKGTGPTGTKPVKLTRAECGFTADFVEPQY